MGDSDQLFHVITFGGRLMILIRVHFYYLHVVEQKELHELTLLSYAKARVEEKIIKVEEKIAFHTYFLS